MAKITYDNKSYLNQNPSVPNANKVCDTDMNEIKSVVNTNYDEMGSELYYKANDTVEVGISAGTHYITGGYITGGTQTVGFTIITPKRLDNITTISFDNLELALRGISGYLNSQSGTVDYLNASNYTENAVITGSNAITINLVKSSAFTNTTNNTPVIVSGHIKLHLQ